MLHSTLKWLTLITLPLSLGACFFDDGDATLEGLRPYRNNAPYANVLVDCIQATQSNQSCILDTLPTIGMEHESPSIDDIMNRVVVSDDWMGENFEALLNELPSDIIYLMKGVTAVVIGRDIRPSYYWNLTGAIYLDPMGLWLTHEQLEVISTEPDYRDAYADPMAFRSFWRWVAGDNGWPSEGVDSTGRRPVTDIVYGMSSLLFHELAHANDLLPPSLYDQVDTSTTVYSASNQLSSQYPSSILKDQQPLQSQQMFHMASILYRGFVPSDEDKAITAEQVGSFFEPDLASDDYAYTSQYEDLAMLFEEAMMKLHFDVSRDVAFVTPTTPEGQNPLCNDFIVDWGLRSRIGDLAVLPRAQFVIESLLPHQDYSEALADLPLPTSLPLNTGWCDSYTLTPLREKSTILPQTAPPLLPEYYSRPYRLMQ